jgi:hypothetical protein
MTEPVMKITYQMPLGGAGQGLSFEVAAAARIPPEALGEILDNLGSEARRQLAVEQLPNIKADLFVNLKLLRDQKVGRAKAMAQQQANMDRNSINRRREAQPLPADAAAVSQFDARIMDLEGHIEAARKRIPYLEAIIDRRDPPELFPEIEAEYAEAAE